METASTSTSDSPTTVSRFLLFAPLSPPLSCETTPRKGIELSPGRFRRCSPLRSDGVITTRARAERRPFFRRRPAAERAWFLASHYRGAIPIVRRFCPFRQADRFCPVLAFVRREGSRF